MSKVVRYNGGKDSYGGSFTNPTMLVTGKEYELLYSKQHAWSTEYILKGVQGTFNSCWFDEVGQPADYPPTFLAVSHNFPTIGERLECYKAEYDARHGGTPNFVSWSTSKVTDIRELGTNTYYVKTLNSVYIVSVNG